MSMVYPNCKTQIWRSSCAMAALELYVKVLERWHPLHDLLPFQALHQRVAMIHSPMPRVKLSPVSRAELAGVSARQLTQLFCGFQALGKTVEFQGGNVQSSCHRAIRPLSPLSLGSSSRATLLPLSIL